VRLERGRRLVAGGLIALALIAPACAATPVINAAESAVRLGFAAGSGEYDAYITPQGTESGRLIGISGGISTLTSTAFGRFGWPDLYAGATYDFSAVLMPYKNNMRKSQNTPDIALENVHSNTVVVKLGIGRPLGERGEFAPYTAGGYQNSYREIGRSAGYGGCYQAELIGGGLKLDVVANPVLVLSANAEGFAVVGGTVFVPSESASGSFGGGVEERVSLDADYRLGNLCVTF
jgi:hypothetical protein